MSRSFTYIDDVISILVQIIKKPSIPDKSFNTDKPNPSSSWCPHRIVNVGNDNSTELMEFINVLEEELKIEAIKKFESMQKGDVTNTLSDNKIIKELIGDYPKTPLRKGIKLFINWYKNYYKL